MTPRHHRTDQGFTLIEVLVVMVILGIIVSSIAAAFSVIVRVSPNTEVRIDDARSTRGLATWLSHDTTSAPPFLPEHAEGGIEIGQTATATNNDCGAPGANVVHLQWLENGFTNRTFVANYRFVVDGAKARVVRYTCSKTGSGAFGPASAVNLTSGLDPGIPPVVTPLSVVIGEVYSLKLKLTATSGDKVLIETGSRNPVEFYP